ncbi:multiple monosaccharide ABC transporter substrate-binding protein [Devosia sp. 2618]|uniref:multiple monosaccharide ABC transporter substrate-binding protein n=1 Tax=Devosia sp. 2618 TaxID=3156454 RepID=UPI00339B944B
MSFLKTFAAAAVTGALVLGSAGLASAQDKGIIGIAMPEQTTLRWNSDGAELKSALEAKGYTVDLQYAGDDIPNQLAQIENMVTKGSKALIIAALDGTTLSAALESAGAAGIKVIAYDRLIRDTPNVDYYTTFDNFQVGVLQANSILKGLGYPEKTGPFNIELFGGSPDDNNAFFFYDGAMSVLQPLIDKGDLVVKSGQLGMDKVGTLRWDGATAQARMDNLLSANYSDGSHVDAVLAPNDGVARGILSSLKGIGYGSGGLAYPIISGQDAEIPSIKAIIAGEQYSTVYKDTRELARVTADLVDTVLAGGTPEGLDNKTYNNGIKVVPSLLLTPYEVDANNYKELVVDSGYISADDLK